MINSLLNNDKHQQIFWYSPVLYGQGCNCIIINLYTMDHSLCFMCTFNTRTDAVDMNQFTGIMCTDVLAKAAHAQVDRLPGRSTPRWTVPSVPIPHSLNLFLPWPLALCSNMIFFFIISQIFSFHHSAILFYLRNLCTFFTTRHYSALYVNCMVEF